MILRQRGLPYQVSADGLVTNNVKVKLVNREDRPQRIRLDVLFPEGGSVLGIQNELPLEPGQMQTLDAVLAAPRSAFSTPTLQAELLVTSTDKSGRESTGVAPSSARHDQSSGANLTTEQPQAHRPRFSIWPGTIFVLIRLNVVISGSRSGLPSSRARPWSRTTTNAR